MSGAQRVREWLSELCDNHPEADLPFAADLPFRPVLRGDPRSVCADWWCRSRSCFRLNERSHPASWHGNLRLPWWTVSTCTLRLCVRAKTSESD